MSHSNSVRLYLTVAVCVAVAMPVYGAGADDDVAAKVRAYRERNEAKIIREYAKLLSFSNVASDADNIYRNADYIGHQLEERGVTVRMLTLEGSPPVVFGELKAPGAQRTLVIYAHYDGQPADPRNWSNPPWQPVLKDREGKTIPLDELSGKVDGELRIFARSAGDDKVSVMAAFVALDALREADIKPSVNLKFYFEGEEEAGSPHLGAMLERYRDRLDSNGWIFCDGPVHQSGRKQLFFGARGVVGVQMKVYGPKRVLHSGHYGNWAPNAISLLASLMTSMRDTDGNILIKGYYDDFIPLTETELKALAEIPDIDDELKRELELGASEANNARLVERIMLPAINFRGIQSGGVGQYARNAIPTDATAAVGFRLVPDQSPERVRELVEAHIAAQGFHIVREEPDAETKMKYPKVIKLTWGDGYRPSRTSLDLPLARALVAVMEKYLGGPVIKMPTAGGSLPMRIFSDTLGAPVINLPIANHDNNQHGPDENLRIQNLWDGIEIYAMVFAEIGKEWK